MFNSSLMFESVHELWTRRLDRRAHPLAGALHRRRFRVRKLTRSKDAGQPIAEEIVRLLVEGN